MTDPRAANGHAMRWVWRGSALLVLLIGWCFILVFNNFHVTPPVVFVCLGFFAGVAAIYTLFRVGASAVAPNEEDDGGASFDRPMGPYAELEREKRTLLKAIKEAEFDLAMGKLSKADAAAMIVVYRARAIEVIKELDVQNTATGTAAGTVRDKIMREARARIALDKNEDKPAAKLTAKEAKKQQRADALKNAAAAAKAPSPATATTEAASATTEAASASPQVETAAATDVPAVAAAADVPAVAAEPKEPVADAAVAEESSDDKRDAKEATS